MVPEDRELVRPDHSSSVGSVRGGLMGISSSPATSTPRRQGDGSDSLHGCVQFGLGSPIRLTLDTGTVVSISKIVAHQRSGDAGRHQRCERLPASSEVPGGSLDVRQRSDCGLHQERGRHEIAHFDADDHTTAQVVLPQGDYIGSRPSARSAQHPGGFPVQSRPDTDHGVDDGHGASTTRVCQVGRAAGRLVCDIRQQTTHQVCIAISGPQGRVDRCHVHAVGQWEGPPVRVPAIQDGPSSSAEDRSVTRSQGDFDHSTATGSVMVSGIDGSVPRRSDPAVCLRSRPADSKRFDRRRGDRDSSLPAVKSTRVETLRAILRAKGHSREAASMMSRSLHESSLQVYESHWSRFVVFCRSKRWHVFRVRSHHFSTYMMHLFRNGLLPSTIISHCTSVGSVLRHWVYDPAADPHIKLLVRAFRLECPVQRRIRPKWDLHLVLLSLLRQPFASDSDVDGEFSDDVIPLKWGTMKCVPVSIGFGKTALIPARIECRARQMCVRQRKHTTTTCGISVAGTWFPSEESATDPGPWMDHRARDFPLESDGSGENAVSCEAVETLHTGLWKNPAGRSADVSTLESQHQRYYEESHKPMDRGDCHGSLHSSWLRIWPSDGTWGQSPFSVMGVQLSGSPSWHPVSGVLEVIWGLPEFVSTRHGLYRWWHVDTRSSGGRTTSSGSRTSSPSSIAYTICMQPLLRRS